jgi:hypothetical protein
MSMSVQSNTAPANLKLDFPAKTDFPLVKQENDNPRLSKSKLESPSFYNYFAAFSSTEGEILILSTILKVLLFPA